MGGTVDRRRIREQEDWAPKEFQGDVGSAKLARHEVNMCRAPLCSSSARARASSSVAGPGLDGWPVKALAGCLVGLLNCLRPLGLNPPTVVVEGVIDGYLCTCDGQMTICCSDEILSAKLLICLLRLTMGCMFCATMHARSSMLNSALFAMLAKWEW